MLNGNVVLEEVIPTILVPNTQNIGQWKNAVINGIETFYAGKGHTVTRIIGLQLERLD